MNQAAKERMTKGEEGGIRSCTADLVGHGMLMKVTKFQRRQSSPGPERRCRWTLTTAQRREERCRDGRGVRRGDGQAKHVQP